MNQDNPWGVPREQIPWYPTIAADVCTDCGVCFDFCTHQVYSQNESAVQVANPLNCIVACNRCESLCPVSAISFPDMDELMTQLASLRQNQGGCSCGCSCSANE